MKNKSQSGSAHLIVMVVLVLALVGALGFIFWQNFISNKTDNDKTATTSTPVVNTPTDNTKYFPITQWGVKGVYDGQYEIQYQIRAGGAPSGPLSSAVISSPDVEKECLGRELYVITKYSATDIVGGRGHLAIANPQTAESNYKNDTFSGEMRKIGDNYYILGQGVTDACPGITGQVGIETQVMLDIRNFFYTLQVQ